MEYGILITATKTSKLFEIFVARTEESDPPPLQSMTGWVQENEPVGGMIELLPE